MSTRYGLLYAIVAVSLCGCASDPRYVVLTRQESRPVTVGPLRIEVTPVDTARLPEEHPFCWHGSSLAGFMLFDVRTENAGDQDLLYMIGHPDFPGTVSPKLTRGHFIEPGTDQPDRDDGAQLVSTDQLRIAELRHETAVILTERGFRHAVLDQENFQERYHYLMRQEMKRARNLGYIPYVGGFLAAKRMEEAGDAVQERWIRAQQAVLWPGVIPAGETVRGYLVFAWADDIEPGPLTLRLPVQPGHAATLEFEVVPAREEPKRAASRIFRS